MGKKGYEMNVCAHLCHVSMYLYFSCLHTVQTWIVFNTHQVDYITSNFCINPDFAHLIHVSENSSPTGIHFTATDTWRTIEWLQYVFRLKVYSWIPDSLFTLCCNMEIVIPCGNRYKVNCLWSAVFTGTFIMKNCITSWIISCQKDNMINDTFGELWLR